MNDWHMNSADWKPKQHRPCRVRLTTGEITEAVYVKDVNKYIRGVNRWRRTGGCWTKHERWIDDEKVAEWSEL